MTSQMDGCGATTQSRRLSALGRYETDTGATNRGSSCRLYTRC